MAAPPITERHKPHFHRGAPQVESVRVATTGNVTISTALNNGDSLDGVTLATGDRVLVKDQSSPAQNGLYVVGATPVRAYDQSTDDPAYGFLVFVREGTANGGKVFRNGNLAAPTIGSTSISFSEIVANAATSFGTPANTYGSPAAGAASTAIRTDAVLVPPNKVVLTLTNKSGGSVAAGDLVRVDTANDEAFTTTTTGQIEVSVGVAQETIANNAAGRVLVSGFAALVNVSASVTRGHYLETHTMAKQAAGNATRRAGSFGQFLTGGTTPTAILWGQTDQTASSGSALTVKDEGSPLATDATSLDFVGAGVTATGTGAAKTITIPGGLSSLVYPLDDARPEDATFFDDFTGASLAGKWARQTQGSGEESYQQGPGASHLRVAYSTGAASRYIWQDISGLGTSWTFETAMHVWEGNGGMVGLHCLSSAGTGVGVFFYTSAVAFYLGRITTGTYASIGANTALSNVAHYSAGARVWLRLRQVAGVYFGSYSFNGLVYSPEISNTPTAFTQARICLGRVFGTSAGHVADFDWFDKTA